MAMGHEVFCPHKMSAGWENDHRLNGDDFRRLNTTFLLHWAQAIYRIPGHSPGADAEMELAKKLGLKDVTDEVESF